MSRRMHRDTPNSCLIRLREVRRIAREHGGDCLSDAYVTRQIKMALVKARVDVKSAA